MKKKSFAMKLALLVLAFALSTGLRAADKNEAKPIENVPAMDQTIAQKADAKTFVKKLSFKEKVKIIKEIRKETKKAKKNKSGAPMILLFILAVLLPPLAVGLFTDWGQPTLWNLLFTICFWLPGIIHAFYILLR